MDIYKLSGSFAASTDAIVSLDITQDGWIVAYDAVLSAQGADALNDGGNLEVSFASTNGIASNDTKASILALRAYQAFLTSGGGPVRDRASLEGLAIAVSSGERMYVHGTISGAPSAVVFTVYLFVMPVEGGSERPSPRRRL